MHDHDEEKIMANNIENFHLQKNVFIFICNACKYEQ